MKDCDAATAPTELLVCTSCRAGQEIGPDGLRPGAKLHAALAALPAMVRIDRVHCAGPLMRHLYEALPEEKRGRWVETAREMTDGIARELDAGDVVLVKASLSMGLGAVVDAIRKMGQGAAPYET